MAVVVFTSNLVLMTVIGIMHTPATDLAEAPRTMDCNALGSVMLKQDHLNETSEPTYSPAISVC